MAVSPELEHKILDDLVSTDQIKALMENWDLSSEEATEVIFKARLKLGLEPSTD